MSGNLLQGATDIYTRYGPLHPDAGTAVTFTIHASDPTGISEVQLSVFEYEWTTLDNAVARPGGTWGAVQSWPFPTPENGISRTFTITAGFPQHSLICFSVDVLNAAGVQTSEKWAFAAGGWSFGSVPIPLWIRPPVGDSSGLVASTETENVQYIHMVFIPQSGDSVYMTPRHMLPDIDNLLFNHFLPNPAIKIGEKHWAFHYSNEFGFIPDWDANAPIKVTSAQYNATNINSNVGLILHTKPQRDWAYGHFVGSEPGDANFGTMLHEIGHSVFHLADEYTTSPPPDASATLFHNVYAKESECVMYLFWNKAEGVGDYWDPSFCRPIPGTPMWRVEPEAASCVMLVGQFGPAGVPPHFASSCFRRARYIYDQLE